MEEKGFIESSMVKPDSIFENPLRPIALSEFTGQKNALDRLDILINAAKKRNEALGHILFSGPPGLGKTTLAQIIAKEMGVQITITSGPVIEKAGDLAGLLTNLKAHDIIFIDEIHRLSRNIEEYLYPAMEDFNLDLMIDSGPNARSVPIQLEPFTLIGATTKSGLLSSPLRSRFASHIRLEYYDETSLTTIIKRTCKLLNLEFDTNSPFEIAKRSRGTPRIANNLVRWVRDYVQIHGSGKLELSQTKSALDMLKIDEKGLDEMDKKILTVIMDHHNGGPVGINTIAATVGEEPETLSEVYEPYLILQGFIKRTPRGREVTTLAYEHLERN